MKIVRENINERFLGMGALSKSQRKEIEKFLRRLEIKDNKDFRGIAERGYVILEDGRIFINGDAKLSSVSRNLKEIPSYINFYEVNGNFDCSGCNLTSLKGMPKFVNGNFDCSNNKISSLKGLPSIIKGGIKCDKNQLASLKGSPETVYGDFSCSHNNLEDLNGSPEKVFGSFNCSYNKLSNLSGSPTSVSDKFDISNNPELLNLVGGPEKVGKYIHGGNKRQFNYRDDIRKHTQDESEENYSRNYSK